MELALALTLGSIVLAGAPRAQNPDGTRVRTAPAAVGATLRDNRRRAAEAVR
jgi:hypothetical protein